MNTPYWLAEAHEQLGVGEVPGAKTSPVIARWLRKLGAWWDDDETPWCGVFVAHCLLSAVMMIPRHWYRAREWLDWGIPILRPVVGCVVVFSRPGGGGHVGFVVGQDAAGRLMVLGGNQGNRVCVMPFEHKRVVGYRWPKDGPPLAGAQVVLPLLAGHGASSANEA